ncbi:MAG: ABC-type bacteriocin/lantibiotic exporter with double-glycine peptidase domain [Parvicella sp.]|jgi:ABC-type bacteriocin/lantibiotic exporter with double-glycine peptidase domain
MIENGGISSLFNIKQRLTNLGLRTNSLLLEESELMELSLPALVYLEKNSLQFGVIFKITTESVRLYAD